MPAPLIVAALPAVLELGGRLIDKIFPDPGVAAEHKLRLMELAQQGELAELASAVERLRVEAEDRANARARETATGDQATPRMLAGVMVAGFFLVLAWLLAFGMPAQGGEALLVLLGALSSGVAAVLSYYFGSSSSSNLKNTTIQRLTQERE
ncbi:MAG: holin family protein [Burkholderiaceae bacterium]|nr:holin family protein [Burkholderiaceae bacterium]